MSSLESVWAAIGITVAGVSVVPAAAGGAERLVIDVYNPAAKGIFPVSSEIISGGTEVVLIDAQFQRNDAPALVAKREATGNTLTTIYISHSDPDAGPHLCVGALP